jgi:hypothetical protein
MVPPHNLSAKQLAIEEGIITNPLYFTGANPNVKQSIRWFRIDGFLSRGFGGCES